MSEIGEFGRKSLLYLRPQCDTALFTAAIGIPIVSLLVHQFAARAQITRDSRQKVTGLCLVQNFHVHFTELLAPRLRTPCIQEGFQALCMLSGGFGSLMHCLRPGVGRSRNTVVQNTVQILQLLCLMQHTVHLVGQGAEAFTRGFLIIKCLFVI